jgi:hypothetical protein
MLRPIALLAGVLFGFEAAAQPVQPIEQSLPYYVVREIDSYVDALMPELRGEPFVVLRGGWEDGDTLEVAVLAGPRSWQDSVRFSQPGRVLLGGKYPYGVAFAGEYRGSQFAGGHGNRLYCISTERPAFVVRYVEYGPDDDRSDDWISEVVSAEERAIIWCMAR